MMRQVYYFAWRDYWHEALLSACAVLGLAAVLAPLLVLYGVKFGIVTTMTDRLRNDPRNLEISPVASGQFSASYIKKLRADANVAFALPRTRAIAATMYLAPASDPHDMRKKITASLEPTAPNDPLLTRYITQAPIGNDAKAFAVILSASAARKLKVGAGDALVGTVERLMAGKAQKATVPLHVQAVLPLEAQQQDIAFVPLPLLEATENFRDGRQPALHNGNADPRLIPQQGWTGEPAPTTEREYPAFRLYAKNLEDVAVLRDMFQKQGIEVYTHAEEIATITQLNHSLNLVFYLVSAAAILGFSASTASNALASVRRKERHLAVLRLVGYNTLSIMTFPLFQGAITAVLGTGLAALLYMGAATVIDQLFASSLQGAALCTLLPEHFILALGIAVGITILASLQPAIRAANIEPSEVLRDV